MISFIAIFALNKSNSPAAGAATSTICPKPSPSLLAPFKRMVISFVNTGFTFRWIYPKLFQSHHSKSVHHLHIFPRIAAQTPTGKFHTNFIHTGRTFQTISYPCTVQSAIILPFTQFIIIETFITSS